MLRRRIALGIGVVALGMIFTLCIGAEKCLAEKDKSSSKSAHARWTEDLQQAIAAAKKSGRPIMANFTGSDWCPPCMAQEREVFATPEFAHWAGENVILLTVDFPNKGQAAQTAKQNRALAEQFKVDSFPTIVFFDAKGKEYGRFGGYGSGAGFDGWLKRAKPIMEKAGEGKAEQKEKEKSGGESGGR